MNENKFKIAIRNLYKAGDKLRESFPDRNFTFDGKLIGDIGEAIGKFLYNLKLDKKGSGRKDWDGWWLDKSGKRREVQIRATQGVTTYIKKPPSKGTLLIFKIDKEKFGAYKVVYNGDISLVWNSKYVRRQKSKDKTISLNNLAKLQETQKTVAPENMIPKR